MTLSLIKDTNMSRLLRGTMFALGVATLAACSDDPVAPDTSPRPVTIRFAARVGTQPFSCTQQYTGLGTTNSTVTATEFMMYVSDVRLLTSAGTEVPVTLTQDNRWQLENIALIDFAAGGAGTNCANASPETNLQVVGTIPGGATYTGIRYTLGLPFARNHGDATTATGPLSVTTMFWSWNAGYKAIRLDLRTTGLPNGWFLHLGSTGCSPTGGATVVPTSCTAPNRQTYTLTNFDAATQTIIADVSTLVANSNLNINQGGPAGCMSGTTDNDCPPLFTAFGLPFNGGAVPAQQTLFRVGNN
jgi:uncharacterized repeat protein (TIGR04052 family)